MFKKLGAFLGKYSKYIDTNVIWQALFGAAAIICAILSCVFDYSAATLFSVLKDIFSTIMVFIVFFVAVNHLKDRFSEKRDKLDYIDFWNENKKDIFECDDASLFEKPLFYGLQAATYTTEDTKELYFRIDDLLPRKLYSNVQTESVLLCAQAILSVFYKTEQFEKRLTEKEFSEIRDSLSVPYEERIEDTNLATWCKILRNDKLELISEYYAEGLIEEEKTKLLNDALTMCHTCIIMLDKQIKNNPNDSNFALLYRAYANRNIAQIHKKLYEITKSAEHLDKHNDYVHTSYVNRKDLFNHFQFVRKTKTLFNDYITQEYILSLAELYNLEEGINNKEIIKNEIDTKYKQWIRQNDTRTRLLKKIDCAIGDFISVKE